MMFKLLLSNIFKFLYWDDLNKDAWSKYIIHQSHSYHFEGDDHADDESEDEHGQPNDIPLN